MTSVYRHRTLYDCDFGTPLPLEFQGELLCLPPLMGETYCFCPGRLSVCLSVRLSVRLSVCHKIVSAPYLLNAWSDFNEIWVRCSPHGDDVQNTRFNHVGSRSRSQFKVKDSWGETYVFAKNKL